MASNFATSFLPSPRSSALPSNEGGDDIMDLDDIIAQLGQLELQLSCRESEMQVASAASRIAEKSNQLDSELHSVLQELSNLESGEEYGGSRSPSYCPSEQFLPRSAVSPGLPGSYYHQSYLPFDDDVAPSLHPSESKNSFGTISSQSSHSSSASTGSNKSPQVLVRIYSPDGSCKTVAVDEQTTVGKVCQVLAKKHLLTMPLNWAIVECLPALHMERILEDHLLIMDQINLWTKDSCNRLLFVERPEKYSIFNDKEVKDAAANNSFSPAVDGFLHFKLEGKKTWRKLYFVLRASGLYYNPKGKGKAACDLVCLQPLQGIDFYFGIDWRRNFKSPTEFGFAFKLPMIQKEVPKFVRFFCVEDKKMLTDWLAAFRLVKHGRQLYDSFVQAQLWSNSQRHDSSTKSRNVTSLEITSNTVRKGSVDSIPSPHRTASPAIEPPESCSTPVRKDSYDYGSGTLKKSIPNIPITTNLTRHLSMQQQTYVRTMPRHAPTLQGFREDDSPSFPSRDGNFMRFPSPDFGLDQPGIANGNDFHDTTATLPKRAPNKMYSESMRCAATPRKYDTLSSRQGLRSPIYDRSPNAKSPSSGSGSYSSISPFQMPSGGGYSPNKGFPRAGGSSDDLCDSYGFLSCVGTPSPHPPASPLDHYPNQELPLPPPPPLLEMRGCHVVTASNQHLPLPPPPSQLLSPDFSPGVHSPTAHSPLSLLRVQTPNGGNPPKDGRRTSNSSQPTTPPAPPMRSAETRLSIRRSQARTHHIIMDLDRVMTQKQEQGAHGLPNLEIPLPPQPSFDEDYLGEMDPFDLPLPPAEILESLKHLRNRPLPPLPPGPPPIHRAVFSRVI